MKLVLAALLALALAAPTLAKGCNPKNTSCCRAPRRPPPAADGDLLPRLPR